MKKRGGKIFHLVLFLILFFTAGFFVLPKFCFGSGGVVINEIMTGQKNNSKNEFIRLYNSSESSINIEKYKLTKKTKSGSESNLVSATKFSGTITAKGYFTISHPDYVSVINADLAYSGASYSIANDNTVILYDKNNNILDKVGFGEATDFEGKATINPPEDKSIIRKKAGEDSSNNFDDFELKKDEVVEKPKPKEYSNKIRINEVLPNPFGGESTDEYIELFNFSGSDIDLESWEIRDSSKNGKYVFPKNLIIKNGDYLAIYRKDFKFALNNSNESVFLFDPNGREVSKSYFNESAKEGVSYNFDGNFWRWSRKLTPGKENELNNLPQSKLEIENKIYKDMTAKFQVKASDKDGDKLKFTWDFGDGHKSYLKNASHKYEKNGLYEVRLKISDGSEDVFQNFEIEVGSFPKQELKIIKVKANPKGKDTENETITIKNNSKKKINLKGWSIATGWKKLYNHPISKKLVLKSGETKEITRKYSAFTLNNKQNKIELRRPDGGVAAKVKYSKKEGIQDDETYEKTENGWQWHTQTNTESTQTNTEKILFNNENIEENNQDTKETQDDAIDTKNDINNNEKETQEDEPEENQQQGEVLGVETENHDLTPDNDYQSGSLVQRIVWSANQKANNFINFILKFF